MLMTKVLTITKRDGRIVLYDEKKIANAILKSLAATGQEDAAAAARLANEVGNTLAEKGKDNYFIEDIQDEVERALMHNGYEETAKSYILYRAKRTRVRESNTALMQECDEITNADARNSNLKRDNANVDGNTAMGSMLQLGSAAAKSYNKAYLLTEAQAKAYEEGWIHIHDFDFYSLTTTCCQIDVDRLFTGGFNTGHGHLREPQDIQSYAALACIAIQSNQNDQHGGQSIPNFDYALAKGVAKSYRRIFIDNLYKSLNLSSDKEWNKEEVASLISGAEKESGVKIALSGNEKNIEYLTKALTQSINAQTAKKIIDFTLKESEKEIDKRTYQAMESVVHNLNSMHSRAGAQTPFSSINYGTDTSPEGRLVIKNIILATEAGLGHGETPIFPIQIFKLKAGVNFNETDPNYDLFKLACRCSAKRLFPNFTNLDAPFNLQFYKPGNPDTEVATMGCRTRVIANVHDINKQTTFGRGNLSFTSINLPRLAIEAKGDEKAFYKSLESMLNLVAQQLLDRFEIQAKKKVRNFPFLMGEGVWLGSDSLGPDDEIREVLKHGTLSIGFIGLAETLVSLFGHHHGESDEMQQKGIAIIKYMDDFCKQKAKETGMNFSLLATPAEGLSGRFVRMDKKRYGVIKGVTDRDYYTNSFHVPVYYDISAFEKINKEAPYHALTPAGHITYVEMNGDPLNNLEAFMSVIRYMHDKGIGYGSVNHPVDRDPVCGYVGIINDVCPRCGRREGEAVKHNNFCS
ncbi:Anaerobic ribonucleoside-triphosphate reductase [Elusimicrobium minutum Pei191]|uniref:Anaerobic ribonucleoside-triphosphate reductase n=1 Tax=Elusimicrobium minutum (strain Pei191) TaxID=445932 RepID=B2KDL1_ELUMP|nr:Anaerobic ribonucleoside-triphosphate reductase [Elusimicrobium minutum Pei191]